MNLINKKCLSVSYDYVWIYSPGDDILKRLKGFVEGLTSHKYKRGCYSVEQTLYTLTSCKQFESLRY